METILDYLFDKVHKHDKWLVRLEQQMSVIGDYADRINTITTQQGQDISTIAAIVADVQGQLSGVNQELADKLGPAVEGLNTTANALHAIANPESPDNPIPTPDDETETPEEPSEV